MIVNQLIRRVDVYRGYQLNITFKFDLKASSTLKQVNILLFQIT